MVGILELMLIIYFNIKINCMRTLPFLFVISFLVLGLAACNTTNRVTEYSGSTVKLNSPRQVDPTMPTGPGCYAKCLIADKFESSSEVHYEYTGDNFNQEGIEKRRIIIQEATEGKWVKKKADKNCLSANPDDCLVWCLVKQDEEYIDLYEVVDTNTIKEFKVSKIDITKLTEQGGHTEWKQVVCDNQITNNLSQNIQIALVDRGYIYTVVKGKRFNPETKAALIKFQRDNALPVGQLDYETLEALGVEL